MRCGLLAGALIVCLCQTALASGYQDFNQGVAARNRDDDDAALAAFSRALSASDLPAHLKVITLIDRGITYRRKKNFEAAIADFNAALQIDPGSVLAYSARSGTYREMNKTDLAIADDAVISRLRPELVDGYTDRMDILAREHRFAEEIDVINAMLAEWPTDEWVMKMRSDTYRLMGDYDHAIADAATAISRADKDADAYALRARAYELRGDLDKAMDDYEKEDDIRADNASTEWGIGIVQWEKGDLRSAARSFEHALDHDPKFTVAMLDFEVVTGRMGKPDPDAFAKYAAAVDQKKWPGPIVQYFLGTMTEAQLQVNATLADPLVVPAQKCQADFYTGEWTLLHGDAAAARARLESAAKTCPPDWVEMRVATIELGRLPEAAP